MRGRGRGRSRGRGRGHQGGQQGGNQAGQPGREHQRPNGPPRAPPVPVPNEDFNFEEALSRFDKDKLKQVPPFSTSVLFSALLGSRMRDAGSRGRLSL